MQSFRIHPHALNRLMAFAFGIAILGISAAPAQLRGQDGLLAALPRGTSAYTAQGSADHDGDGRGDIVSSELLTGGGAGFSVRSSTDLALLHRFAALAPGQVSADAFVTTDDLDGDGIGDLVVGHSEGARLSTFSAGGLPQYATGVVVAQSSATGRILWTYRPPAFTTEGPMRYGRLLALLDDVDGDGIRDVAAASTGAARRCVQVGRPSAPAFRGRVDLLSGRNGRPIWSVLGSQPGIQFADALASLGDVDGDGVADLARLDFGREERAAGCGPLPSPGIIAALPPQLVLHSGRDGRVLRARNLPDVLNSATLLGTGDLDADGVPDLFFHGMRFAGPRLFAPQHAAVSGRNLATLWGEDAPAAGVQSALPVDDWDGDGAADLLIVRQRSAGAGYRSGRSGRTIAGGPADFGMAIPNFGSQLAVLDDLNGDGDPDYLAVAAFGLLLVDTGAVVLSSATPSGPDAAPGQPALRIQASGPPAHFGSTLTLDISGAQPGEIVQVFVGTPLAAPLRQPGLHPIWLDPTLPLAEIQAAQINIRGVGASRLFLPALPGLDGLNLAVQALAQAPLRVSANAITLRVGF